jgi:soluble lytic murein transglycosylase-like protein
MVSLDEGIPVNIIENPDIDPLTGKPLVPADQVLQRPKKPQTASLATPLVNSKAIARARRGAKIPFSQRAHLYDHYILKYAKQYGIPVKFARAVIFKESGFRVNALGGHGEIGLMQVKPSTAREMGFRGSRAALYDPENNIKYGMKYLSKAKQKSDGTLCGWILKYNAGLYAKRMNKTSARYCRSVKASMAKGI